MKRIFLEQELLLSRVSEILKGCGYYNFSGIPTEKLEFARNRGTAGHRATELLDVGKLDWKTLDERLKPFVEAWQLFKNDFQIEILESEIPVVAKFGFRGTADAIGKKKKDLILIDKKLTANINPVVEQQTAAYEIGYEETYNQKIAYRICVQLLKTGRYKVEEYHNKQKDRMSFLASLTTFNNKVRYGLINKNGDIIK